MEQTEKEVLILEVHNIDMSEQGEITLVQLKAGTFKGILETAKLLNKPVVWQRSGSAVNYYVFDGTTVYNFVEMVK